MIVSHRHRFIFLKTRKTAGTSVEIALARICGDDDVLTPIGDADAKVRFEFAGRDAQNIHVPWRRAVLGVVGARSIPQRRPVFYNHMPAAAARALLGKEIWNSYFKFTIERNPFDRLISFYYFQNRGNANPPGFSEWLPHAKHPQNWPIYSIGQTVAVDYVIQYDQLGDGLAVIGERLGEAILMPEYRAKAATRQDRRPPSEFLTPADIENVGRICKREIEYFGYQP